MTSELPEPPALDGSAEVALSDLLNRVLDKGLVIVGSVTISVADVDLVTLDLSVALTAVESAIDRERRAAAAHADVPVLPAG
jgi:gas vesicle structural protein